MAEQATVTKPSFGVGQATSCLLISAAMDSWSLLLHLAVHAFTVCAAATSRLLGAFTWTESHIAGLDSPVVKQQNLQRHDYS